MNHETYGYHARQLFRFARTRDASKNNLSYRLATGELTQHYGGHIGLRFGQWLDLPYFYAGQPRHEVYTPAETRIASDAYGAGFFAGLAFAKEQARDH